MGFFVFFSAFFTSALISSSFCPVSDSSASEVTVDYRGTGYFVTVDSPDLVSLSVDATPTGQTVVSDASTVNVVTNAPSGYKLYLSTSNDKLVSSDSSITQSFSPTTAGSSLSLNSWGFSLDAGASFSPVPKVIPTGNYTEAGLVASGATLISSSSSPNYPSGTNVDIYYGINSDTSMPSGTYSTTVYYTAFAEGIPQSSPSMQDFTIEDCRALNAEETIKLTDSRDGKEYNVAKLKDGNCWMQQNLALDGDRVLTPADSNVTENISLPANITEGAVSVNTAMQIIKNKEGYDGNLYNWCAATVSGDCSGITTEQTNSVCPKGWRLPSNTGSPSYLDLFNIYSVDTYSGAEATPFYYTRAGYYISVYGEQGNGGNYWVRTLYNSSAPYLFSYGTNYFYPQNYMGKNGQASVRCVMADTETRTLTNLTYMQDMTTKICANSVEHESKSLIDSRDNNSYRVTKLKDGNCWMTQNLKLAGPRTLTPNDSNVATNVTIPAAASSGTSVDTTMQIWNEYSGYDGKYYNWCAATVSDNCSSITTEQTNSVCPKGFRLPSGTGYHSFSNLFDKYNVSSYSTAEAIPLYFTRAGGNNGSYFDLGATGLYLTRNAHPDGKYISIVYYNDSVFYSNATNGKADGSSLRCLSN